MNSEVANIEDVASSPFRGRRGLKFLIIRFSSIGDIVFTTPVVRCLKQQVPDAEVHYLTKFSFHKVIAGNPYVDKFYYLNNDWDLLMHELKQENYDYIIDLHHNLRTLRIKRTLKVKSFSFNKLNVQKFLLTNFKINLMPADVHIVDRNMETVKTFGVKNDGKGMDYFIPKDEEIKQGDLPHSHSLGFVSIVIGAAHFTKRLPVEKLQKLCASLHHPIVLLGGPDDKEAGDAIAAIDPVKIYNASGKFSINESADIVRKSKLVISHDTGLMHIAAALKKPVIAVWGNTMPLLGVAPYYGNAPVLTTKFEVEKLSCRPCSKIGRDKCPKGHFKCMWLQDVEAIAATAQAWAKTLR